MKEEKESGVDSTEAPEKMFTEGGYECTIMELEDGTKLVIRECFDRWRLVDDGETEAEHTMRKRLLNRFKKQTKKARSKVVHVSRKLEIINKGSEDEQLQLVGVTYYKPKE